MAAALHFDFRAVWRDLKHGRPGRRFQERYERAQREERTRVGKRVALWLAAVVCLAIGVVLTFIPGPAILFFFLAGGFLATESKGVARTMDWLEVKGRAVVAWGKRRWRGLSRAGKILVTAIIALGGVGMAYASYWFLTR